MDKTALLTEILRQNPADVFARYGLAMTYAGEGKVDDALSEYSALLASAPDYVPAYQMSGQLLLKLGRPEEAKIRLTAGLLAAHRTSNQHAASEMQALLDELAEEI